MTKHIGAATPELEQQKLGYARLTIDSVNVQDGFEVSLDLTGSFAAGFDDVPVVSPSVDPNSDTEVFVIGIHSVDPGPAGIGSSLVGNANSLIGTKILETGSYSNIEVPIYPISSTTSVRVFGEDAGEVTESQQFPPTGTGTGGPKVQAAVYDELFFGGELPEPAAESDVIEVTGAGLNPDDIPPLVPVEAEGEFDDYTLTVETTPS